MFSCLFGLHFLFTTFTIILFSIPISNGENIQYGACFANYSCGKIHNIGYPFWGGNRPEYCGILDFKLNCKDNSNSFMNVLGANSSGYAGVRVLDIDTSLHTMIVSPDKIFDHCFLRDSSKPFLSSLKLDSTNKTISLFYGCNKNCESMYKFKSSRCISDGTYSTFYYFGNLPDIGKVNKPCSCKNNITFPVDMRELIKLRSNVSLQSILMKWPNIRMEYMTNFKACSKCEESGGRCGSISDHFVCFCQDGQQPVICPETGQLL